MMKDQPCKVYKNFDLQLDVSGKAVSKSSNSGGNSDSLSKICDFDNKAMPIVSLDETIHVGHIQPNKVKNALFEFIALEAGVYQIGPIYIYNHSSQQFSRIKSSLCTVYAR